MAGPRWSIDPAAVDSAALDPTVVDQGALDSQTPDPGPVESEPTDHWPTAHVATDPDSTAQVATDPDSEPTDHWPTAHVATDPDTEPADPTPRNRTNLALWLVAAVAVLSLGIGLVVGRFVISPAEAEARAAAPTPGLITVPVGWGELSNDVTIRGNIGFSDTTDVTIDAGAPGTPAVVTGHVPAVGAELGVLSIALEVTGRPVIVLPGELPAYRSLSYGMRGPDVVQFKQAMRDLGIDAGDPSSDVFDATAANAVAVLYDRVGYPAPEQTAAVKNEVAAAEAGVTSARGQVGDAQTALDQAQTALATAQQGPPDSVVVQANNMVASAQRALDAARVEDPVDPLRVADLEDALRLAQVTRAEQLAPADTQAEQASVTAARTRLDEARSHLAEAEQTLATARNDALPQLPAEEILFLTDLPRRVDAVHTARGEVLDGPALTVSGARLELTGSASEADGRLLETGEVAFFDLPDGGTHPATITKVEPATSSGRTTIEFAPEPMDADLVARLQGANVRIRIPVGATQGAVLNVPAAALTAGPGGEARVEVVEGNPLEGENAATRLVVVETGLAAGGAVEVRPVSGELARGDLVVVGR